jgi:single stranded DNA-binding protein
MLPQIVVTGNVAAAPTLGYTENGTPVCNVTIYANGRIPGDDKHVERIKCAFWGKAAESASQYLKVGMPVTVSGAAITEPYLTRDGKNAANFKILRAEFHLINTGNGNGANGAAGNDAAAETEGAVAAGDPMTAGLPPVAQEPPF